MFCIEQAALGAEARATIMSPFVGRILDWHKKNKNFQEVDAEKDPGVFSVKEIYTYVKMYNPQTSIMAASFRNLEEIYALAGVDFLTIR